MMNEQANSQYLRAIASVVAHHKLLQRKQRDVATEEQIARDMDALRDLSECFHSQFRHQLRPDTVLRCVQAILLQYPDATQAMMRRSVEEIFGAPLAAFAPGGSKSAEWRTP
jgi:hypothetical protein